MQPLTGILIALGAVTTLGTVVYLEKRAAAAPAPATATTAGATGPQTLSFLAGHQYTLTVTLAGPITGNPDVASVEALLPSNYAVTSVSANPTAITLIMNTGADSTDLASLFVTAVTAPAGSLVNLVDNGLSPGAPTAGGTAAPASPTTPAAPMTWTLTQANDGTTVDVNVGDTIQATLAFVGEEWTFSFDGDSLSGNAVATSGTSQTNTFSATSSGTTVVTATNSGNGNTWTVTVDVS